MPIMPPHLRPLFSAIETGCVLIIVPQGIKPFGRHKKYPDRPHIWHIGDDTDVCLGPEGFHQPSLEAMFATVVGLGVIVAEPDVADYVAVAGAAVVNRVDSCIIECRSEHEADWIHYAQKHGKKRMTVLIRTVRAEGHA